MDNQKKSIKEKPITQQLQFNVAQLLKQQGPASRSYIIQDGILPDPGHDLVLTQSLNGRVKFSKTGRDIFVTGQFETALKMACTRCLVDVEVPVQFEIEETFTPSIDIESGSPLAPDPDSDEATIINEQHILDLTEVIRQTLDLSQPGQVLCKEDCLGLCLQCGANRNEEYCDCETDAVDIRLADLLALKDKLQ